MIKSEKCEIFDSNLIIFTHASLGRKKIFVFLFFCNICVNRYFITIRSFFLKNVRPEGANKNLRRSHLVNPGSTIRKKSHRANDCEPESFYLALCS